jgi:hypothetical protein
MTSFYDNRHFMFEIVNAVLWGTIGVYVVSMYYRRVNPYLLLASLALVYGYASQYILKYWSEKKTKSALKGSGHSSASHSTTKKVSGK